MVTFGGDGVGIYLDGYLQAWDTEFTTGIDPNREDLAIGANTWARTADNPDWRANYFTGTISDFVVYGKQLDRNEVAALAGVELNPVPVGLVGDRFYGTDDDDVIDAATEGVNDVHGNYGNDVITGTDEADVLDGGHGEDTVYGGGGNDIIYSRSDGREPIIAQDYNGDDDPDDEINDDNRTLYAYQPIESDDVFAGGAGADTFIFNVLINAKEDIILKHVNDDGTINWGNVAGENNNVHDHWVDRFGNDTILDFNPGEGDEIKIIGHTADILKVVHVDSDNDHIIDSTIIYVQSNQGAGGGAHNLDQLGTIRLPGVLITESDVEVHAHANDGIVETVNQIDEAITPRKYESVPRNADGSLQETLPELPPVADGELGADQVFAVHGALDFSGEWGDHIDIEHSEVLELAEGSFTLTFNAEDIWGMNTLFSKDASGLQDGGHLSVFVKDSRLAVRLQSATDETWVKTAEGSIQANRDYQLVVTFGGDGVHVYLDGTLKAWDSDFTGGINANAEDLAIGANTWARTNENPDWRANFFTGIVSEFIVYGKQLDRNEVAALAGIVIDPDPGPGDDLTKDQVFAIAGQRVFSGNRNDYEKIDHIEAMELTEGTISLSFLADSVTGRRTLFSKDAYGFENGGHISAFVKDGRLMVRLQSDSQSVWLSTTKNSIQAGQEYHMAISFGPEGARLYLNGQLVKTRSGFTQGIEMNTRNLLVGANSWKRNRRQPDWTAHYFDGVIADFTIYGRALTNDEIIGLYNG